MLSKDGLSEEAKCEDLVKVIIGDDPEKFFQVGSQLPPLEKEELIEFLKRNIDVFAWNAYEAPGVDPDFICHNLNVNPAMTPKKQLPRRPSKEHAEAVRQEVTKLKKAGAIKEIFYPSGWQTRWWSRKRLGSGEYVSISQILIKPALKIHSPCPKSISW